MNHVVMVEIRAAEGGDDAKDLVRVQAGIYGRFCEREGFECEIIDDRPGMIVLEVRAQNRGKYLKGSFLHESGGHRWQRVPPTERRGRRHTSTITVAVMPLNERELHQLDDRDVEWKAVLGSGAGGQARNKTSNAVQMTHKATGLQVRVESTRSQSKNRELAKRLLVARLDASDALLFGGRESEERRRKVGSGQRGDKIRTIRMQSDQVVDHRTGATLSAKEYMRGDILPLTRGMA